MPSFRRVGPASLIAVGVVALAVAGWGAVRAPSSDNAASQALLPDLDQETPSRLSIREQVLDGQHSFLLGFRSAVRNIGDGPLIVDGHRDDTSSPYMTVDQLIDHPGQAQQVVPAVGSMQYAISRDHQHWHYLEFEHYQLLTAELRLAGSNEVLVQDQKTGFCLGDRFRVPDPVPAATPAEPVYTGRCGLSQRGLLHMRAGISVGYTDSYAAYLEGQALSLDGLPAGRYVLVHRVNVDQSLRETSLENNAASVLIDLEWRGGKPYISLLAECSDTAECDGS